ncbi:hypothetical protein T484DRAFT_1778527 [Baffinella frigidus]|nr:hypothetical protein T484DRAFT_1778527 [Cryptophyta sp. CCMP2293]
MGAAAMGPRHNSVSQNIKYSKPAGGDPPPPVPTSQLGQFRASTDKELWLFHRKWVPTGPVTATLTIVHGTVDHSGMYNALAEDLVKGLAKVIP